MIRAIRLMDRYEWVPWALAVFGLLYGGTAPLMPLYDYVRPVVSMQGEIVERTADSVTLHMWGSKNRACKYIGIQGFSQVGNGPKRDTIITRLDMPSEGKTKPAGVFDIGHWRLQPVTGADHVSVYVQHDCDGRVVLTKITEVTL
jgi:hypothetical protein